jgi:hypothetical protein
MRKTLKPTPHPAPATTMRPATPQSGPSVQEIEHAHGVLTSLEVENRSLRAERELLLRFAQLFAVHSGELAIALKDLSRDLDLAKLVIRSTPAIHTFTEAEQAWLDKHVHVPAEALADGFPRRLAYTVSLGLASATPSRYAAQGEPMNPNQPAAQANGSNE